MSLNPAVPACSFSRGYLEELALVFLPSPYPHADADRRFPCQRCAQPYSCHRELRRVAAAPMLDAAPTTIADHRRSADAPMGAGQHSAMTTQPSQQPVHGASSSASGAPPCTPPSRRLHAEFNAAAAPADTGTSPSSVVLLRRDNTQVRGDAARRTLARSFSTLDASSSSRSAAARPSRDDAGEHADDQELAYRHDGGKRRRGTGAMSSSRRHGSDDDYDGDVHVDGDEDDCDDDVQSLDDYDNDNDAATYLRGHARRDEAPPASVVSHDDDGPNDDAVSRAAELVLASAASARPLGIDHDLSAQLPADLSAQDEPALDDAASASSSVRRDSNLSAQVQDPPSSSSVAYARSTPQRFAPPPAPLSATPPLAQDSSARCAPLAPAFPRPAHRSVNDVLCTRPLQASSALIYPATTDVLLTMIRPVCQHRQHHAHWPNRDSSNGVWPIIGIIGHDDHPSDGYAGPRYAVAWTGCPMDGIAWMREEDFQEPCVLRAYNRFLPPALRRTRYLAVHRDQLGDVHAGTQPRLVSARFWQSLEIWSVTQGLPEAQPSCP